jgi:exonuclease VII small subunit
MTLAQIDTQIEKWKQIQSKIALKLVDLDEMPTYLCIRRGIYRGTTAIAIAELGDGINRMWTLSALWEDAFSKLNATRAHAPMPWEKEKWLNGLGAMMVQPVIAVPGNLDLSDTLQMPTLTLGGALTEVVNQYDRVLALIHRIDAQISQAEAKVVDLSKLASSVGAGSLSTQITAIADQVQGDPLGVSMDSFAAIESQLKRFQAEVTDRQAVVHSLDQGEDTLSKIETLRSSANTKADECEKIFGAHQPIPNLDLSDLHAWGQTLRTRANEAELGSIKVGLSKWTKAIDSLRSQIEGADRANQDSLNRYQELSGRFSAAQAKAISTRCQNPAAEHLANQIRATIAQTPKNLEALEAQLIAYERLVRAS